MQSLINRRRTYYHHNEFEHNWLRLIPEADGGTITFNIENELSTTDYEYVEYSLDAGKTWIRTNNVNSTAVTVTVSNVKQERAVCFRGKGTKLSLISNNEVIMSDFKCTVTHRVEGDVRSMLYLDDFENKGVGDYGISGLFYEDTTLRSAANLSISASSLGFYAYRMMFYDCSSLVEPPTMPSVTGSYSFQEMFRDCTALVTPPALPGDLSAGCYYEMFRGCRSLVSAPALSKTSLHSRCYQEMFMDCTSLVTVPNLPATTLKSSCYESMFQGCSSLVNTPTISATTLADYCCYCMFKDCVSLVNAPTLSATTLQPHCYQDMFNGCTSLTAAPVLPATTLVDSCYNGMFVNCSNLKYIKALFTTTPSTSYTYNWVIHVAATGIFIKNPNADWDVTGDSGVPTGWNEAFEVEYLQSTGTQYINTGITNTLDTELYVDFQLTGGTSEDRKIIGQGFKFGFGGHYTGKWRIVDDEWYETSVNTDTSRHVFSTDGGKYYLDSTLLADRYSHKAAGTYPMLLFAVSSQNSASPDGNCAKMKLYGCKIYEGNSLVRDFVPIAIDDGIDYTGYMYDKVSCSLFSNAGSGYFTIGLNV